MSYTIHLIIKYNLVKVLSISVQRTEQIKTFFLYITKIQKFSDAAHLYMVTADNKRSEKRYKGKRKKTIEIKDRYICIVTVLMAMLEEENK